VRLRLAEWAAGVGMDRDGVDDLVLAAHEAPANVADHAYRGGSGDAWVDADRCAPGELVVVVSDEGSRRTPPEDPGLRGRGMTLIAALASTVAVQHGDAGTRVVMHWRM
jgi:anti-sigma regulatory factor (Ser/Thr protein kinase)